MQSQPSYTPPGKLAPQASSYANLSNAVERPLPAAVLQPKYYIPRGRPVVPRASAPNGMGRIIIDPAQYKKKEEPVAEGKPNSPNKDEGDHSKLWVLGLGVVVIVGVAVAVYYVR